MSVGEFYTTARFLVVKSSWKAVVNKQTPESDEIGCRSTCTIAVFRLSEAVKAG